MRTRKTPHTDTFHVMKFSKIDYKDILQDEIDASILYSIRNSPQANKVLLVFHLYNFTVPYFLK